MSGIYSTWSDKELLEELQDLDNDMEYTISEWEANFINSQLTHEDFPDQELSPKQRTVIIGMLKRYHDEE